MTNAPRSFAELFQRDEPYYLSIGMTYEQYWYGDVRMVEAFREAERFRQERENTEKWLQGMYFYHAVTCAMTNAFRRKSDPPAKYPDEPYDIFPKRETRQEREAREEQERLQAKLYMSQMMRVGKHWGG